MKLLDSPKWWLTALAALLVYWGAMKGPDLYVWWNPPFVPGDQPSIVVTVEHGVPVEVAEQRRARSFRGKWETRVLHLTRGDVICPQIPPFGPVEDDYHETVKPSFSASWVAYTGDVDGECLRRLARYPGMAVLETFRWAWVWWKWVPLPPTRSIPFQVGQP